MATMVCRGLQPCVESQFIETNWPRMAAHIKLPSTAMPHLPQPFELDLKSCFVDLDSKSREECNGGNEIIVCNYNSNVGQKKTDDIGQWTFLQSLSNGGGNAAMTKQEAAYVHPLVKRSRSTLSEKSLALCTEDLGNETGADFVEDAMFSDLKIESLQSPTRKRVKSNTVVSGGNKKFPPPLTTITGLDSVRVRSHRENGRLIMEAVKAPARLSYFQVERSHGRLRLSILKSSTTAKFDSAEENTEKEEDDKTNDDVEAVGEKSNYEEDVGRKVEENGDVGGAEIEIEKLERPCNCRCNEAWENNNIDDDNNNGMLLLTREPLSLLVATS